MVVRTYSSWLHQKQSRPGFVTGRQNVTNCFQHLFFIKINADFLKGRSNLMINNNNKEIEFTYTMVLTINKQSYLTNILHDEVIAAIGYRNTFTQKLQC